MASASRRTTVGARPVESTGAKTAARPPVFLRPSPTAPPVVRRQASPRSRNHHLRPRQERWTCAKPMKPYVFDPPGRVPGRPPTPRRGAPARPGRSPARAAQGVPGGVVAVDDLDLDVAEGEFVTLLGPSGSGKTTVLRLIAGFEQPTAGTVALRGRDVTGCAPFDRDVNTVFQDYALFPHLTRGARTSSTGCACRGRPGRAPRAGRTRRWPRCGSSGYGDRGPTRCPAASGSAWPWPAPWSTGPRCCCSTSRSARSTSSCASRCRSSSRQIQRDVGITFVFVTHDQEEALTLADRVVVFNRGRIEQVGPAPRCTSGRRPRSSRASSAPPTSLAAPHAVVGRAGELERPPGEDHASSRPTRRSRRTGSASTTGTVDELVYTGPTTRCVVDAGRRRPAHGAGAGRRPATAASADADGTSGCPGAGARDPLRDPSTGDPTRDSPARPS